MRRVVIRLVRFVDQVRIQAAAGDGGDGCCSFRREKFVPKGGPDGGDGGDGGDIVLRADVHTDNLVSLFYDPVIRGKKGAHGQGKNKHGKSAQPTIVLVPVGTIVYRLPESLEPKPAGPFHEVGQAVPKREIDLKALEMVVDLSEPGQECVLCRGGRGGKGNTHFKSSTNRAPRKHTEGESGEQGWFFLELRTIAFAALVGYPNAGKSTLIGKLSAAHPKVAPYPFTTLNPVVGVVELPEYRRVTIADIPGLIEGAHQDRGLGHEFLRHVVRCKMLLFVLDMAGTEGRSPIHDLESLREELKLYDPVLADKPWCVVANKMDLPHAAENLARFIRRFSNIETIPISAETGQGVDALTAMIDRQATAFRGTNRASS